MTVIGVSIAIPDPWGCELQRARLSYGDEQARGIPTHVTVLPPTEVDDAAMDDIHEHLLRAAGSVPPFLLELRGTGTFHPVSPVVFIQVARGIPSCEQLEARVRDGVLARELSFTYHPHVTVAHGLPDDALERAHAELADYHAQFAVDAFSLYVQGEDGVWRPIRRYPLGDAGEAFVGCES
ncbi:2'-5' RNA ligase family protein [Arsenicicoccus sp. MKL-02]|uniref:2'-5' RNA ligase family protein n=1 Tax=Arsenicicoccus cauae TaxID=2663847 RepID=A0A6I3ICG7_9MICO|nr:2'-5' RNA ligase family protein [Arsenicicoccus cauae]MTB71878.1 2'-5' RNA ligase family protein [Arsenicicoccus cauae]